MPELNSWVLVFGRLHVVVLHFPVALIIVAAGLELLQVRRRRASEERRRPSSAALTCMWIGAIAALAAAWTGWTNGDREWLGTDGLELHRWLGVASFGTATLSALVGAVAWWVGDEYIVRWFRLTAVIAAIVVSLAGHFGGALVHGPDHLWAPLLPERPAPVVTPDADENDDPDVTTADDGRSAVLSANLMSPTVGWSDAFTIIDAHCVGCHSGRKPAAGLRLDSPQVAADVIVPGDAASSELIEVLLLPAGDKHLMPKGDPPLPADKILVLARYVQQLGSRPDAPPQDTPPQPEPAVEPEVTPTPDGETPETSPDAPSPPPPAVVPLPDSPSELERRDAAVEALRASGFHARVIAADSPAVEVRATPSRRFQDDDLSLVTDVADWLVMLDMTGSEVSEQAYERLGSCTRLERLRIGETGATDAAVTHLRGLNQLRSIDLHGTQVTDEGLDVVVGLPSIRRIFVWGSQVTPAGVRRARRLHPSVEIDMGR